MARKVIRKVIKSKVERCGILLLSSRTSSSTDWAPRRGPSRAPQGWTPGCIDGVDPGLGGAGTEIGRSLGAGIFLVSTRYILTVWLEGVVAGLEDVASSGIRGKDFAKAC